MGLVGDIIQMNVGQILQTPEMPAIDMTGQTIVITGANTGLGFEAAKHLGKDKGERARQEITASSNTSPGTKVEVWQVDMSDYSSVLAFGDRLKTLPRIDAFLANAGIDVNHWELFEGVESTITVNVISTFLVAMLAIPRLRETSIAKQNPTHLVFTGSVMHIFAKDKYIRDAPAGEIFQELNERGLADMADRYNLSKLLVLMGTHQLAQKFAVDSSDNESSLIINYVNPGWCKTELFRTHDGGFGGRLGLRLIGRTAEEGSRTLVHAAVAGAESNGKYMSECRVKKESTFLRSSEAALTEERFWTELLGILEEIKPGVTQLDS